MPNDIYGRSVVLTTANGVDTYLVTNPATSESFQLQVPSGKEQDAVYSTINAMAPNMDIGM